MWMNFIHPFLFWSLGKQFGIILQLSMYISYNPAIPFLGKIFLYIYARKYIKYVYSRMFIRALFLNYIIIYNLCLILHTTVTANRINSVNKKVKNGCRNALQIKRIISSMIYKLFSIQHSINIFEYSHVSSTILFTGDVTVNKIDEVTALMGSSFCCGIWTLNI